MADFPVIVDKAMEAAKIALDKLQTVLQSIDADTIRINDSKGLYNISNSLAGTARIIADLERASRERETLIQETGELLKAELRQLLNQQPELLEEIYQVLNKAESRLQLPEEATKRKR